MDGRISKRATNKLSHAEIKSFLTKPKKKMLSDGHGMYLTRTLAGTAVWRIKYRRDGKERLYSLGIYPEIGLEAARAEREQVRELLRQGRDPVVARQVRKAETSVATGNTFAAVCREWLTARKKDWSGVHFEKSERALERDALPELGRLPVTEITPAMVAGIIKAITNRGARDTAGKVLQHIRGVFRFAQATGLCRDNPADAVREVLPKQKRAVRRPAVLEWNGIGEILRAAETAPISASVRMAHRLCAFSVARISNIVSARWPEFNLDGEVPTWTIPRAKMKSQDKQHDHAIILGPTIAAELRAWRESTGGKGNLFPSPVDGKRTITREAIEKTYRNTLGLEGRHSPHSWRAAFATLARDAGLERDAVELTLDHIHDSDVVRAYDRGERLEQRKALMAWWDAQLTQAQRGVDVLPLAPRRQA